MAFDLRCSTIFLQWLLLIGFIHTQAETPTKDFRLFWQGDSLVKPFSWKTDSPEDRSIVVIEGDVETISCLARTDVKFDITFNYGGFDNAIVGKTIEKEIGGKKYQKNDITINVVKDIDTDTILCEVHEEDASITLFFRVYVLDPVEVSHIENCRGNVNLILKRTKKGQFDEADANHEQKIMENFMKKYKATYVVADHGIIRGTTRFEDLICDKDIPWQGKVPCECEKRVTCEQKLLENSLKAAGYGFVIGMAVAMIVVVMICKDKIISKLQRMNDNYNCLPRGKLKDKNN